MGRLYIEPEVKSFRGVDTKEFLEKIIKIIPSEIIIIYVTANGILEQFPQQSIVQMIRWTVAFILLVSIPFFLKIVSGRTNIWNYSIVSCLAFLIWIYAISGQQLVAPAWYDKAAGSLALVLFTGLCNLVPLDK